MIYLDNAATSFPKPTTVAKAMVRAVDVFGANPGRSGHKLSAIAENEVYKCRVLVSEMFNSKPENVIFTANCTESINMALKGFLKENDEVLITDMEHNAMLRPLYNMNDIKVNEVVIDLDNDLNTINNFEKAITKNTKLIAITACSNVIGKITPIKQIGELCKKHNIKFLVDAAQLGGVRKIDIHECNISFLALAPHKSLFGVAGLGVLIIQDDIILNTLLEGGTGTNSESKEMPTFPPERYEAGTIATPAIVALAEGIKFINKKGMSYISEYENDLLKYTYDKLKNIDAILYTNNVDETYAGVLSFNIKKATPNQVSSFLDNNNIYLRGGYHCAYPAHVKVNSNEYGSVRIGITIFNNKQQIDTLISKLIIFKKDY